MQDTRATADPTINRRHALALAAGGMLSLQLGCSPLATAPPAASIAPAPGFDAWADGFAADWVRQSPEGATFAQYFSGAEQAALERQLTPMTPERRRGRANWRAPAWRSWRRTRRSR